jgi:hypothetical protein
MSLATLNGVTATAVRVSIPANGLWWAEVECASGDSMTGAATLVVDDLTLRGTIITGGAYEARTRYRIVGGAGGWGRTIAARAYVNDLSPKKSAILADAARECGETLGTVPASDTVAGGAYVRASGPASRVLDDLYPRGWYVDEAGVTQIGRRARVTYTGTATRITDDHAQVRFELAPPSLAGLLPGAVVDGVEAVDVEHVVGPDGVRTTLWGKGPADTSRMSAALERIVGQFTARHRFYAPWEYRVVARTAERLDLQAVRASAGMPDLRAVKIRPGVGGARVHPTLGSLCLVSFVNGDPARPVVTSFDDQDGAGWVPTEIALQAGATGASPTEHATSAEALVLFVWAALAPLATPLGGAAAVAGAIGTALAAMSSATLDSIDTAAALPAGTTKTAIANLLAAKTADTTGKAPSIGWPNVRGG